jgi:hypothetical protein
MRKSSNMHRALLYIMRRKIARVLIARVLLAITLS